MKKIIVTLIIIANLSCNAQTPIVPLSQYYDPQVNSAYFKDTQNDFEQFLGEWKFNSDNRFFKMKLIKKTMIYSNINKLYQDLIIGEYIYKENGIEKVNTINSLLNSSIHPFERNIVGKSILGVNDFPGCNDCSQSEKRIILMFDDPTRNTEGLYGEIELRRVDENGIEKLKLVLRETGNIIIVDDQMPEFTSFNLPFGTYILTRP